MLDFLSEKLKKRILKLGNENVYEIRIRRDKNVCVSYKGEYIELNDSFVSQREIESFFLKACSYSVYSFQKSIVSGYITTADSERIGLCGEFTYENGQIISVKNLSSMVIRVPHQIVNSSEFIQPYLVDGIKNILIISPPGMGKTTVLRDLALFCSDKLSKNVVVIDEKFELYQKSNSFNLGKYTDVLLGITKIDGLKTAIKNLKPDIIILDELSSKEEVAEVYNAVCSGVNVICSAHGEDLIDLKRKSAFARLFENMIFDNYIILENIGKIKKIYKANGNVV